MSGVLLDNPLFYRLLNFNSIVNSIVNSIGIAYITSYLNSNGHNVWLYNTDFLNTKIFFNGKK